jgi:hypothetical protein
MVRTVHLPAYFCTRCEAEFDDYNKAIKHELSDAEHVESHRARYEGRSFWGVIFYPVFWFGREVMAQTSCDDEKWLKKPIYEIFIAEPDGQRTSLQVVGGERKSLKAWSKWKKEYELHEKMKAVPAISEVV